MNYSATKVIKVVRRDGFFYTTKRAIAWILAHNTITKNFSFKYHNDLRLSFSQSMLTYALFASSNTRSNDDNIIDTYLAKGGVMVDVGAHAGSLSIIAADVVGSEGQVISLEPSPKFFSILKKNVALNKQDQVIKAYNLALGENEADVFLNEEVADDTTNYISNTGTKVKQVTLDSLTTELPIINLLKIDVEGYEDSVLNGASDTLKKTEVIYIEFISDLLKARNVDPQSVISKLDTNFKLYTEEGSNLKSFKYNSNESVAVNIICIKK